MKACYAGSFDPVSNGHLDIIRRASKIFDEVHVVIALNSLKQYIFTDQERLEMVKLITSNLSNVYVTLWDKLIVDYCKENKINVLLRGIRNILDYENEYSLALFNEDLAPGIETLIMFPNGNNKIVSSSRIRELIQFNSDISKYVPKEIRDIILNKFKK